MVAVGGTIETAVDEGMRVAEGGTVVAEGIETPGELAQLRALRCGFGQGYLFSRAVSAEATEALLSSQSVGVGAARR